jgi:hypothetical protein
VCAVAGCAARTHGRARAAPSCDIHSLADLDGYAAADPDVDAAVDRHVDAIAGCYVNATANRDVDPTANRGIDPTADLDPAAADSTGQCCGRLGRQAGVAVTR